MRTLTLGGWRSGAMLAASGLLSFAVLDAGCGRSDDVVGAGGAPTAATGGAGPTDTWREDFEPCAEVRDEASLVPVNMLITVDKSGSMDQGMPDSKWESATAAFTAFFNDPAAAGLSVALRLWPEPDGCNDNACDAAVCATPQVALGSLSDDAHRQALIDLLTMTMPAGGTPVSAALEGAAAWADATLAAAPDEQVVIVLVTDGEPNGCEEDIANIAAIAAGAADAGAPVFVVGIEGSNEDQINQIAAAGTTTNGYFVGSTNAEAELLAALEDIQGRAVSCSFAYPEQDPAEPLSTDLMRIDYASGGDVTRIPRVTGADACGPDGGWYLDDPINPTTITLCPETCSNVQTDLMATVEVAVGCECEVDEDCPGGNVCEDNRCVPPCQTDADCPDGEICHEGHCIPEPGKPCGSDAECPEPLLCVGGQCTLGEVLVGPEEAVQGGAFSCAVVPAFVGRISRPWYAISAVLGLAVALAARRRRSS